MKKLPFFIIILLLEVVLAYEVAYKEKVYPGIIIEKKIFGNWKKIETEKYFNLKNKKFYETQFFLSFGEKTATISGKELEWGYNPKKISDRAFDVARSGNFFSDCQTKLNAFFNGVVLDPSFNFNEKKLREFLAEIEKEAFLEPKDALFQFKQSKVTAFQKEEAGQELDIESAILAIKKKLGESSDFVKIELVTRPIKPEITVEEINNLGIKELLAKGVSYFTGSPTSRIHNIILASSRLNGLLIRSKEEFSFNQALGDVSQTTGYQRAYIIKEGETILDDGGGVCQVSTTLFRAALNAGLPIIERHPHSYRVSYYEQGGFGPGSDATVFYPTVDLKFQNDTPTHILIQTYTDTATNTLTFELYGTNDGRKITLSKPIIWEQIEPPEDLYKDEPSLSQGVVKQVERKAWGAKVSVNWNVERDEEIINQKDIFSFYKPWQAVYLRGIGEF